MANVRYRFHSKPSVAEIEGRVARATNDLRRGNMRDEMRNLGRLAVRHWRNEAPKDTGQFADSISYRSFARPSGAGFTLSSPHPLATFIYRGTRPHVITGNPILAFYWEKAGEFVFRRSVNHPGTKPNPYRDRAYKRWEPFADATLRRLGQQWVRMVAR